ncbi:hypothetical protein FXO09_24960 [Microcystis aeruginosa KLA2]|nr:hypothetical protein FXO09_24960 [Microcystis aeruginosa KLA2]
MTRKCHSKYNPIERCWAVLENYWNGAILDSIDAALKGLPENKIPNKKIEKCFFEKVIIFV